MQLLPGGISITRLIAHRHAQVQSKPALLICVCLVMGTYQGTSSARSLWTDMAPPHQGWQATDARCSGQAAGGKPCG